MFFILKNSLAKLYNDDDILKELRLMFIRSNVLYELVINIVILLK